MKGKKKNHIFVSNYINSCSLSGKQNINEIIEEAKKRIEEIDKTLITINNLKEERSNLLDVIYTLKHD